MFGRQIVCIFSTPEHYQRANILKSSLAKFFTDVFLVKAIDEFQTIYKICLAHKTFSVCITIGIKDTCELRSQNIFTTFLTYNDFKYVEDILKDIKISAGIFYANVKQNPNLKKNVIVFDFDETLVYEQTRLAYNNLFDDLHKYRQLFDYIVLWTHGTTDYINEALATINPQYTDENNKQRSFKFDFIISRKSTDIDVFYNKGLGYVLNELNRRYSLTSINYAVLVDDKKSNFKNDYDLFVYLTQQPIQERFYAKLYPIIESRLREHKNSLNCTNIVTNEDI